MSAAATTTNPEWERLQRSALIAGCAGLLLCMGGGLFSPAHFFRAYLVAFNFWLGIALGCLVLLMVQYLTGGAWGILLRRILEAGALTVLPLAVFAVPLAFGIPWLFPWAQPDAFKDAEMLRKQDYLNVKFFLVRLVIYFVVWLVLAVILSWWSRRQDTAGISPDDRRFRLFSGPGLVLYGLTITFASIDWGMSLEPRWASTMFPPLFAVGQVLEGMAFALVVLIFLSEYPPLAQKIRPPYWNDLGNLLLTFVMIWAYLSFSQFLLIWAENLPEEIPWYLRRLNGGWEWVALALVLFQFATPFVLLLFRDVKGAPRRLASVAILVLVMRFVDLTWWIEASFPDSMSFYLLLDVAAVAGVGGLCMWWFLRELRNKPLLPLHEPYMAEYLPEGHHHHE